MATHVCPTWVGYLLLSPLRRLVENPEKMLGDFVQEGMTILEPGCAMGYFTLPLARMVGPAGRVVAVDIQPRMLSVLARRAGKTGLAERIDIRKAEAASLGITDLSGAVDLALLIHVVHEMPNQQALFAEIRPAMTPLAQVIVIEPRGHVSAADIARTARSAEAAGFSADTVFSDIKKRRLLLTKAIA